jgi:hypothetical protein
MAQALRGNSRTAKLGYGDRIAGVPGGIACTQWLTTLNIPHKVIMRGLTNVVADGNILRLVERFLAAGVMVEGVVPAAAPDGCAAANATGPATLGTPQGGVGRHSLTH